jgi:UDP:flavonoid glycosyltransferase YjiC (YdhE family)
MRIGLQTWGSEGDIAPFLALAEGLVRAGHEVTLVVTDNAGRDYSARAQQAGFRLISVPLPSADPHEVERVWQRILEMGDPLRQAEAVMTHGFDPVVEPMYAASVDLCAHHDVVVGHFFVHPLRVAAEKSGTPVATLHVVHNTLPSRTTCPPGMPDLGPWMSPLGWRLARAMVNRIFLPRVNRLRLREGLGPERDVMTGAWVSDRLNLVAVSPRICQRPPDWDARHHVCGFLRPASGAESDALPPGMEAFLQAGEAPVYVTFGSMLMPGSLRQIRETLSLWREAIQMVGCRAIFQVPALIPGEPFPDDRTFLTTRAPYRKVFPRTAMVAHHGGAGTTQSVLLAGRPSLVVAHVADQFFWGQELERLGVAGKTLPRKGLTARGLAGRIRSVLANPGMAGRARDLGGLMADEDGVETAIRLIERHLGDQGDRVSG